MYVARRNQQIIIELNKSKLNYIRIELSVILVRTAINNEKQKTHYNAEILNQSNF